MSTVAEISGRLDGKGLRVAVIAARFNEFITSRLVDGAVEELVGLGVRSEDVTVLWTPGALELPLAAAAAAATGRFDALICAGCVIKGETDHYHHVADGASSGIARVALEAKLPVANAVLTVDTLEQAMHRAGAKAGNKGSDAARAAVEMARLLQRLRGP